MSHVHRQSNHLQRVEALDLHLTTRGQASQASTAQVRQQRAAAEHEIQQARAAIHIARTTSSHMSKASADALGQGITSPGVWLDLPSVLHVRSEQKKY